jgi:flagellin-like protein
MNIKDLLNDDDAVSPVIGVILMVAITVILAAVIGTFVLGLGDQVQTTAPQASFSFDFSSGKSGTGGPLTITHDGGDSIPDGQVTLKGDYGSSNSTVTGSLSQDWGSASNGDVSAGDSKTIDPVDTDTQVRIVWTASSGDNSATLGEWSGPDA